MSLMAPVLMGVLVAFALLLSNTSLSTGSPTYALRTLGYLSASPGRFERELSGPGWTLRLDRAAQWKNDPVFLPPVNLSALVRVPYGNGRLYLGTLRILPELTSEKPQFAAAKKVFLNMAGQ